jgi:hypothetical protein
MPPWVVGEIGLGQQAAEILQIAVQIAADEHFGHAFQRHDSATTARRIAEMLNGATKRSQDTIGVGHGIMQEIPSRKHEMKRTRNKEKD